MDHNQNGKQSLIGVSMDDEQNKPLVTLEHRDGTIEARVFESGLHTGSLQPHSIGDYKYGALEKKTIMGLTRSERVEQSVRVEAALLKCMSSTSGIDPKKHAAKMMVEVLRAMGGEWEQRSTLFQD